MSRPYAEVIGNPISHSKSPLIHNFWLGKLGIDAEYRACHVRPDGLAVYLARRREDANWRGCNVTIPHKETVQSFLDAIDDKARAIGAVNTVYRRNGQLIGTNTDVDGVDEAIAGINLEGEDVCVIGSGGASRAALAALADRRCSILLMARNVEKAMKVANDCNVRVISVPFKPESAALTGGMLVINATQLGMVGQDPMPSFVLAQLNDMAEDALVFDMVYAPLDTDLLKAARSQGLRTADGLRMLVGQAATAFERFFGVPSPREYDAELRVLLTS